MGKRNVSASTLAGFAALVVLACDVPDDNQVMTAEAVLPLTYDLVHIWLNNNVCDGSGGVATCPAGQVITGTTACTTPIAHGDTAAFLPMTGCVRTVGRAAAFGRAMGPTSVVRPTTRSTRVSIFSPRVRWAAPTSSALRTPSVGTTTPAAAPKAVVACSAPRVPRATARAGPRAAPSAPTEPSAWKRMAGRIRTVDTVVRTARTTKTARATPTAQRSMGVTTALVTNVRMRVSAVSTASTLAVEETGIFDAEEMTSAAATKESRARMMATVASHRSATTLKNVRSARFTETRARRTRNAADTGTAWRALARRHAPTSRGRSAGEP